MSQLWQPLGLGLRLAPSEGTQWDVSADFDANFEAGRFAYLGQAYPDETAWRTAIGATASGLARTFLAKARTGGAELFVNGKGVMFGSGEAWLNGICQDKECKRMEVRVIALQATDPAAAH